jgi:stage V sporulation protein G
MEITEVKIFPVQEDKLKAYVTIVLDGCFVVRDLKIINGSTGLFVAMPSKKRSDGSYKDIAHPLNKSTRVTMEKQILEAYLTEIKRGPDSNTGSGNSGSGSAGSGSRDDDGFQERAGNE